MTHSTLPSPASLHAAVRRTGNAKPAASGEARVQRSRAARRAPRHGVAVRAALAGAVVVVAALGIPPMGGAVAQGAPSTVAPTPPEGTTALTFSGALELARLGPSVVLAEQALEQAEAQRDASFGNASGTLKGGYAQTWGGNGDGGGFDPLSLNATFDVVPLGPAWDASQSAVRSVEKAQLDVSDARAQATSAAATAYLTALRAQQQTALDVRAVALARQRQAHVEEQAANGDATDADVLAARLATTQAQTTAADDRLTLEGGLDDLAAVLGRQVDAVAGDAPAPVALRGEQDVAAAVNARSDVRVAELAAEAARASRAAAVRGVLPSAQVGARVGGGDGVSSWSAGVGYDTNSFQPSLSASYTPPSGGGGTSQAPEGTSFTLSLGVSVPLDTALSPALHATDVAVANASSRLEQTRAAAQRAIAAAERSLATRSASAALKHQQATQQTALAQQAAQRLDLGLIPAVDLEQARLDADQAALDAGSADDAVLLARVNLAIELGHDPMEVF